jgi:hypothetical protein
MILCTESIIRIRGIRNGVRIDVLAPYFNEPQSISVVTGRDHSRRTLSYVVDKIVYSRGFSFQVYRAKGAVDFDTAVRIGNVIP